MNNNVGSQNDGSSSPNQNDGGNVNANNMNNGNGSNGNPGNPVITAADIPLALKARYFGSGLVVGVFVSPLVQKALGKITAGSLFEKGSDIVSKARDALRGFDDKEDSHDHAGHDHAHAKPAAPKPPSNA